MALEQHVLVTGAAGYVGTHVLVELIQAGYSPVALDNRESALSDAAERIFTITGHRLTTYTVDLLDKSGTARVFSEVRVHTVLHLAGLKAVRESQSQPFIYYKVNVIGTINLLEVMEDYDVYNIIFSSSSKVYGTPQYLPLDEQHPTGNCTNPYGRTKYMVEQILQDLSTSNTKWNVTILRYFNPCGAHSSGILGEGVRDGTPRNLMPCICHVAEGKMEKLRIYGHDYDTPDGTSMKGYTHVVDLAKGHIAALKMCSKRGNFRVFNLGSESTHSILDMVKLFEQISGRKIQVEMCDRKPGEIAVCSADSNLAYKELGWKTTKNLRQMCEDMWHCKMTNIQKSKEQINGTNELHNGTAETHVNDTTEMHVNDTTEMHVNDTTEMHVNDTTEMHVNDTTDMHINDTTEMPINRMTDTGIK